MSQSYLSRRVLIPAAFLLVLVGLAGCASSTPFCHPTPSNGPLPPGCSAP